MEALRRELGIRLGQIRYARGLSQARLGALAGVSHTTVGEMERGARLLDDVLLCRIASALGLDAWEVDRELVDIRAGLRRDAKVYRLLARNPNLMTVLSALDEDHEYTREELRPLIRTVVRMERDRRGDDPP